MRKRENSALPILFFLILFWTGMVHLSAGPKAKNIVFLVPDGMGLANVTAARIYAFGTSEKRLVFETLDRIGYQSTHSRNSLITDSAAAASACASGQKFNNGEISFHSDTGEYPPTILELARDMGKSTGLVATSAVTHATPAAFGAHVRNRKCENEIARQFIEKNGVDVLLGAGLGAFKSSERGKDRCGTHGNFIDSALKKGYRVVYTRDEMMAGSGDTRLLGLFAYVSLTPSYRRDHGKKVQEEPTLSEMTRVALDVLERNKEGFFLLVEGSQVDWANHANNLEYQVGEIMEFDRTVKRVLEWVDEDVSRREDTLIIVVPDHDTGGFAIKGPRRNTFPEPGHYVAAGWVHGGHTGVDTVIWSQGPYSEHLGKAIDNTDIYYIMKAAFTGQPYIRTGPKR